MKVQEINCALLVVNFRCLAARVKREENKKYELNVGKYRLSNVKSELHAPTWTASRIAYWVLRVAWRHEASWWNWGKRWVDWIRDALPRFA
jgi:hypothetical protein